LADKLKIEDNFINFDPAGQPVLVEEMVTGNLPDLGVTTGKLADGSVTAAKLADGAVSAKEISIAMITPGAYTEGQLLYITGWDETEEVHEVTLADCNVEGARAMYILQEDCDTVVGIGWKQHRLIGTIAAPIDTDGSSVGDPIYLSAVAGGWTLVKPTAATSIVQIVGHVAVVSVDATTGEIEFNLFMDDVDKFGTNELQDSIISTAKIADAAVTGAKLPNDAVNYFENGTVVAVDHGDGGPVSLLAADPTQNRIVLVQAIATEDAAGAPEFDVGSATTAPNGLFDDLAAGIWVTGERFFGALMLPATEALVCTINTAGTAGAFSFRTVVVTNLIPDNAINYFETATEVEVDHADASPVDLLVADASNDRIVIVQALGSEAAVGGPDFDVGSETTDTNGVFDDIAAGAWGVSDRFVGACVLPATEKLQCTIADAGTAGKIKFRIIALTPLVQRAQIAADAIDSTKLADGAVDSEHITTGAVDGVHIQNDAVNYFETAAQTAVDHAAGGPVSLLVADPSNDRIVIVQAIATETAVGAPEFDVGSATTNPDSVFDDIGSGVWEIGERWVGACILPATEALVCTINAAGTAGAINFRVINVIPIVQRAQLAADLIDGTKIDDDVVDSEHYVAGSIDAEHIASGAVTGVKLADNGVNFFETATVVAVDHEDASPVQLLAADASNDRLILVQAIATEAATGDPDFDVGSETTDPNGIFDDIAAGAWALGDRFEGFCILPATEKLECTIATAGTAGAFSFRVMVVIPTVQRAQLAADIIDGTKIDDDVVDSEHYAALSIDTEHIGNLQVTNGKLGPDAVDGTKLADNAVDSEHITLLSVDRGHLAADLIDGTKIDDDVIDSEHYVALSIDSEHIAANQVTGDKIANFAVNYQETATIVAVDHADGGPVELLAADASNDRLILIQAIATEAAAGGTDFDVGPAGDTNGVFDDLAAGIWGIGDRFQGFCNLPATEALICTINDAGTAGVISFRMIPVIPLIQQAQLAADIINGTKVADDAIATEHLNPTLIQYAEVEVSTADILQLSTVPKQLVAAPGNGYVLEFISLLLAYDYVSAAYTIGGATNLQVKYTNLAGDPVSVTRAVTGFLDGAADAMFILPKLELAVAPVNNAPLMLTLAGADPTVGNSPMHAKVLYRILNTGLV